MLMGEEKKLRVNRELKQWFVMAPIYYQEVNIKNYLDANGVESYLPMKEVVGVRRGKKELIKVPLVSSLIFIYATESELKEICKVQPYLYYKYTKEGGAGKKMVVPTKQMEDFLRLSKLDKSEVIFFEPDKAELDISKGTPIRVHSSNPAFDGVEGVYIKIKGKRNKHLVLSLNGLIAVATLVDINLIEKL